MSILSAGKVRKTLLIDYLTQRSNVLTGESYTNKKNHEKTTFKKRKSCCVRAITICCHIASFARFNSTGFISISKSLQSSKIRLKSEIKEEKKVYWSSWRLYRLSQNSRPSLEGGALD
jgi:hypothetical protein